MCFSSYSCSFRLRDLPGAAEAAGRASPPRGENCFRFPAAYIFESAPGDVVARAPAGLSKLTEVNRLLSLESTIAARPDAKKCQGLLDELRHFFAVEFSLWEGTTGDLIHGSQTQPVGDQLALASLVGAIAERREADFLFDADGVLALAVPIMTDAKNVAVATAWFVTREIADDDPLREAAARLSMSRADALDWARGQEAWSSRTLLRLAEAVAGKHQAEATASRHAQDVQVISEHLATTYEEISLLHAVSQHLRISSTESEIGRMATEWLSECIPAEAFAVQYLTGTTDDGGSYRGAKAPEFYAAGDCPLDQHEFTKLVETVELKRGGKPFIANANATRKDSWPFPRIREVIVVPLSEGNHVFGWLAAFNHREGLEFGTNEAQLLNSLGALLGIHGSNRQLYREQAEFIANVVRALVSAIDAKDPYTSGHSDRVSRVAVRIALEMRCGPKMLNTIYMAGLLHDIGKIGIDDNVLRKAGRLTEQEFEHIKLHPEMGYRILADLKQLADVLPAVLHHHEQWDGGGYPHGLKGEETPLIARIMAVADAYDAMTSDRPYRKGMDDAKVEQIFRAGAGQQWDAKVVDAYLAAKEDVAAIAARERVALKEHWV